MKELIAVLCLLLISCTPTDAPGEFVYQTEAVNVSEPEVNVSVPQVQSNIDSLEPEIITNESVPSEASLITGSVIEDLSVGKQDKMLPALHSVVGNSSCYSITWEGFGEQAARWPLEVRKETRFEYLGGNSWKGWITSKLFISSKMLESDIIPIMIDDLSVSCVNATNFAIDWNRTLASHIK